MDDKVFASVRMTDEIKSDRMFSAVPVTNTVSQQRTRRRKTPLMRALPSAFVVVVGAAAVYFGVSGS